MQLRTTKKLWKSHSERRKGGSKYNPKASLETIRKQENAQTPPESRTNRNTYLSLSLEMIQPYKRWGSLQASSLLWVMDWRISRDTHCTHSRLRAFYPRGGVWMRMSVLPWTDLNWGPSPRLFSSLPNKWARAARQTMNAKAIVNEQVTTCGWTDAQSSERAPKKFSKSNKIQLQPDV